MASTSSDASLVEVPKPAPSESEVRVKVVHAAVNPAESKVRSGAFAGRFLHVPTEPLILGWDLAGTVDTLGDGVTDLQPGDAVCGHLAFSNKQRQGSFAEYITIPRGELVARPEAVPSHIAAAAATVAMTSLQSMRDLGGLGDGGKVLIMAPTAAWAAWPSASPGASALTSPRSVAARTSSASPPRAPPSSSTAS